MLFKTMKSEMYVLLRIIKLSQTEKVGDLTLFIRGMNYYSPYQLIICN